MHFAPPVDEYTLDQRTVRRMFDRASATYAEAAVVQSEIRSRLLERLDVVKLQPERVLDLGAASGSSTRALKQRYPKAQVIALDLSHRMLQRAAREQSLLRRFHRVTADAHRLPFRDATIDFVFSNLMLAWCNDVDAVLAEAARVLRVDGLLTFTTLGPDTLREVREAFARMDRCTHVHRFLDMHDLGDALVRTGFADPVMETERLVVTYPSVAALLNELRRSGAGNATIGRAAGLTGRGRFDEARAALESTRRDDVIPITVEVVYGHAWKGEPPLHRSARGETVVPLEALRRSIRKS
nr:malonyl-[acyl-carrier protein] O-methyltransferase BioC [Gammaproteobacteria bacterium]